MSFSFTILFFANFLSSSCSPWACLRSVTLNTCWRLIIKPTRCTNFSNLFLEWNSACFGQFLCPSSGVFHCTHSDGTCHAGLLTACCSQSVSRPVWLTPLLCVQWKTPDDGLRKCTKHVQFHSKNNFEKLMLLVDFIKKNLSRCTVTWTSNLLTCTETLHSCGCALKRLGVALWWEANNLLTTVIVCWGMQWVM